MLTGPPPKFHGTRDNLSMVLGWRRCVRELGRTGLRLRLDVPLTA